MKLRIIGLLIGIFMISLLVGCTVHLDEGKVHDDNTNVQIEEKSRDEGVEGNFANLTKEEKKEVVKKVLIKGLDNEDKFKKILSLSDKVRVYPRSKKLKIGDKYKFVLAVTSPDDTGFDGLTFVEFKDALSNGLANKINADDKTMNGWLSETEYGVIKVDPGKKVTFVPVIIDVKDEIAPGVKTQPGTYTFQAFVYDNKSTTRINRDQYELYKKYSFTVMVVE